MFSVVPFVGWVIDFILNFCLAVPFYFCYNAIADKWLFFLPENLQTVGFWESVALFFVASLVGALIQRITPTIVKVDSSATSTTKNKK